VFEFFQAWNAAFHAVRSTGMCEASALFTHSAQLLARRINGIVLDSFLLERGCMLWQPQNGIPSASPALAS
jgi:hypothetical protein